MDSGEYKASHKAFLQALFARPTINFTEARPILAEIFSIDSGESVNEQDVSFSQFQDYMNAINLSISPFEYEIRSLHPQKAISREPQEAVYALVNLTSDPQTQLATAHTPDEISFVKRLLDSMFDINNTPAREVMATREMDAINLARVRGGTSTQQPNGDTQAGESQTQTTGGQAASINKNDAERVVSELIEGQWLEKSQAGYLSLSTRGIMELGRWLVATYNEPDALPNEWQRIKYCTGCKHLLTVGQRCANEECSCRLHEFCARSFFRDQQDAEKKCPVCREDWAGHKFVGEKAARREGPSLGGRRSDARRR